jgi:hypothetical protein
MEEVTRVEGTDAATSPGALIDVQHLSLHWERFQLIIRLRCDDPWLQSVIPPQLGPPG